MAPDKKIKTLEELSAILDKARSEDKKIVLCHGLFDLVHPGHVFHFKAARKYGDIVVVSVTPDLFARKGPGRPVFNQRIRLETLASIEYIDYVVLNEWPTAVETIHRLKPHVYLKGQDYADFKKDLTGNISLEVEAVKKCGGDVVFTDEEMFSSSHLINKFFSHFPPQTEQYLREFRLRYRAEEIIAKLKGLSDLKVLVIGEAILDQYVYCTPLAKAPKESILTTRYESEENFAGGSVAVANHLAGFCKEVVLLSYFGPNEEHLSFLKSKLRPNIELLAVLTEDRPTIIKRRYVDQTWMTKMHEIQFLNDLPILKETEREFLALLEKILPEQDLVAVADFGHGMLTESLRHLLLDSKKFLSINAQTNSANLGFNPVTKYPKAHFVSVDEPELKLAAQIQHGDLYATAKKLQRDLKAESLMVTRGPLGSMFLCGNGKACETPALSTRIVDRTGAGDAFFSITAPLVFKKFPPELIGFIGNCVGALAVEIVCNREPVDPVSLNKFIDHLLK